MAEALAVGFASSGAADASLMAVTDRNAPRRAVFAAAGIPSFTTAEEVLDRTDVVFVCVKPAGVRPLLAQLAPTLQPRHLLVSIAAGVSLADIEAACSVSGEAAPRCVRVMPNTPALVGACAAALSLGSTATHADGEAVSGLMKAVGVCYTLKEALLDAVTGLSGSGPAYVFLIAEAMADGGVAAGLPRDVAAGLAAQTLAGAAAMLIHTGKHPAALKDGVASPGGTTIAGIRALEKGGVRGAVMDAVLAAAARATEMAKQ